MIYDKNIVDGLKNTFFQWAITKGYTERVSWSGNALSEDKKIAPWFRVYNTPARPINNFKSAWYQGIFSVEAITTANSGLTLLQSLGGEIMNLYPKGLQTFNGQDYTIVHCYEEAEETEGSYLILPILIIYRGWIMDADLQ